MHYVMSDIHGDMEKFQKMIELIKLRWWDRLYILGDVIDRGSAGVEILKYIMQHRNIFLLKGNHERDMCRAIIRESKDIADSLSDFESWFDDGGRITYEKLLEEPEEVAYEIVNYVDECPDYEIVTIKKRTFIMVHAGLLWNKDFSLEENLAYNQKNANLYYIREGFLDRDIDIPYTIIAGHTPVEYLDEYIRGIRRSLRYKNNQIIFRKDKILIDCGCGNGRNLSCLRLEDMKEFYVE